jgi:nitrate/nitrite transporter NarK
MGFSLAFLGSLGAATGIIGLLLMYPGGIIADRWHPLRVHIVVRAVGLMISPINCLFIFFWRPHMTLDAAMHLHIVIALIVLPLGIVGSACEMPLLMKLFPQERYGQFCSANAMIRGLAMAIGGIGCGAFLDYMKQFNPDPSYCYRFVWVWNFTATVGYFTFLLMVYAGWKRLGGLDNYMPPKVEPSQRLLSALHWIFGKKTGNN